MKVFIQLPNEGKGYILTLPSNLAIQEIRELLDQGYDIAIPVLLSKSLHTTPVSHQERQKAKMLADFVLTPDYSTERLA